MEEIDETFEPLTVPLNTELELEDEVVDEPISVTDCEVIDDPIKAYKKSKSKPLSEKQLTQRRMAAQSRIAKKQKEKQRAEIFAEVERETLRLKDEMQTKLEASRREIDELKSMNSFLNARIDNLVKSQKAESVQPPVQRSMRFGTQLFH